MKRALRHTVDRVSIYPTIYRYLHMHQHAYASIIRLPSSDNVLLVDIFQC